MTHHRRLRTRNGVTELIDFTTEEQAQYDAEVAQALADRPAIDAEIAEAVKEKSLLDQGRLLWIIETLLSEIEAIRRGDPTTERIQTLRNRIDNL
jgi:hypothetical protein